MGAGMVLISTLTTEKRIDLHQWKETNCLKTKHNGETSTMGGGGSFRKLTNYWQRNDPYFNVLKRSHSAWTL
jgi:hypothetical protein